MAREARTPTPEQQAIIDAHLQRADLTIEAGAGSGKTTTLRMLAEAAPARRGIYVAYNKAIAGDARGSFPASTTCSTAHSLAFRAVGRSYRHRLNGPRMTARDSAAVLRVNDGLKLSSDRMLKPEQLTRMALGTVRRYCWSADVEITQRHVPTVTGIDDRGAKHALADVVVPIARQAWADVRSKQGRLRFEHDHYLKLWQLSHPRLDGDYVMLDEAQDANPVVASVIEEQEHMQRILVGDRSQAIYGWRGAVDAMSSFGGRRLTLSQSFRFGPAVADEANKWLRLLSAPLQLRGFERIMSRLDVLGTEADAVLCRTNAEAVAQVIAAMGNGRRAALVGGGGEIKAMAEAAVSLKHGRGTSHPELFLFTTWGQLQEYAEWDPSGSDLKVFVNLIDTYGPEAVIATMDRLADEREADLIVSTAHKAKGREWDRVRIASDFHEPRRDDEKGVPRAEAMLAYVAITRARIVLDRAGLSWVDTWVTRTPADRPAEVA
jgi:superfamily I DNA/RNA helicase